jgi:hypothetical protein
LPVLDGVEVGASDGRHGGSLSGWAELGPSSGRPLTSIATTGPRWDNGEIVENLFYDLVTFMRQIGLSD